MKLFVLSAYPNTEFAEPAEVLKREITQSQDSGLELVADPGTADLILFFESHPDEDPLFFKVYSHPVFKKYYDRCVVYQDADYTDPVTTGVYPSVATKDAAPWVESTPYLFQLLENKHVGVDRSFPERPFLYSFVGASRTHTSRAKILDLPGEARAYLRDTSKQNGWELANQDREKYHKDFADSLRRSLFVLCPRGISPCSYRLNESMRAGRVPVIISDDWLKPGWIPWDEFSISIREADIPRLPEILAEHEPQAEAFGKRAREVWETYLSRENRPQMLAELLSRFLDERNRAKRSPLSCKIRAIREALKTDLGRQHLKKHIRIKVKGA